MTSALILITGTFALLDSSFSDEGRSRCRLGEAGFTDLLKSEEVLSQFDGSPDKEILDDSDEG